MEDLIFWYKAEIHGDFRIGAPEFWNHSAMHYRDRDEAAVNDYDYGDELGVYVKANKKDPKRVWLVSGDQPTVTSFKMLANKRVDVSVEDANVAAFVMKSFSEGKSIREAGCTTANAIHVGFSEKNPKAKEFVRMLNEGLATLRKNGKLKTILAKYGVKDWQ
jgi:polar amino acid transport system substrate-binding protein